MLPGLPTVLAAFRRIQRAGTTLRRALDNTCPIAEARAEEYVRVREQALLERDDDELRAAEARAEEGANVLRVRQVKRGVDLVEDVDWCWLELQERQDEGERDERARVVSMKFGRVGDRQSDREYCVRTRQGPGHHGSQRHRE